MAEGADERQGRHGMEVVELQVPPLLLALEWVVVAVELPVRLLLLVWEAAEAVELLVPPSISSVVLAVE